MHEDLDALILCYPVLQRLLLQLFKLDVFYQDASPRILHNIHRRDKPA